MFYFLNKNRLFQFILFGGMFLLCLYSIFFQQITDMVPAADGFLYSSLHTFFCGHPILFRITTLVLLLIQLFLFQLILKRYDFLENDTLLPLFWFLFFYYFSIPLPCLSPALFTPFVLLLLLSLVLNSKVKEEEGKKRIFYCSSFVSLLCLLDMTNVLLLLFIFIVLIINNIDIFKKFILTLIGFALPFIYLVAICYLSNHLPDLQTYFRHLHLFDIISVDLQFVSIWSLSSIGLFVLYTLPTLKRYYDNKLIAIRERYAILCCLFIVIAMEVVFENFTLCTALPYLAVPLSLFIPMLCQQKHARLLNDLLIGVLMSGFICLYFAM